MAQRTVTGKELTSGQKEKPHGKKNNLTATEKRIKKCPLGVEEILPWVFFFLPGGFSFCREVTSFAVTVVGHHTKVRKTASNWIVSGILNKVGLQ